MGGPPSPSVLIDRYIASLHDWRGERLAQVRRLFHAADPEVVEEWKWLGTPTWSHDGVIAVATTLRAKLKFTFARGAHLPDPEKVFNNGLGGKEWRSLDLLESDPVNEPALKELIRAAVEFNRSELAGRATDPRGAAGPSPGRARRAPPDGPARRRPPRGAGVARTRRRPSTGRISGRRG
ncbi:MAG TPA: DUF1801 domain-containing protein [Thermoplasmata archaeon]|nr:DUF1801 domain-containing protein [Thermoplasmata archaeon]